MGLWSWLFGERARGGTRIEQLQVLDVIDGDTLHVELRGEKESLRLCCVDTEESQGKGGADKPITHAGKLASEMAKAYFRKDDGNWCHIDIEFETDDLEAVCLEKHRDKYGRLICYIHKGKENFNLKLIEEGWSPYFVKYGYSRLYHERFAKAQEDARSARRMIWDPKTNAGGPSRDYDKLLPWWERRGALVQRFRDQGRFNGGLDVREDYEQIIEQIDGEKRLSVFCDLQGGTQRTKSGDGAYVDVGTQTRPFSLWIPHADSPTQKQLIERIDEQYAGYGDGFCYAIGRITTYKGKPQIELTDLSQLSDEPS